MVVTWRRFVRWSSFGFKEIAVDEGRVFVRKGNTELTAKMARRQLATPAEAKAEADRLIAQWGKAGFESDKSIERALPSDAEDTAAKSSVRQAWNEAVVPLRLAYRAALAKAGIAYGGSFFGQTKGDQDPNVLARHCLEIAETSFGVEFARALFDEHEHNTGGWPVPDQEYAAFYLSPARVAEIAEKRLKGRLGEDDGRFPARRPARRRA